MNLHNPFYGLFSINASDRKEKIFLAKNLNVSIKELDYYNEHNILPEQKILNNIYKKYGISKTEVMLGMGIYDMELKSIISSMASTIQENIKINKRNKSQYQEVMSTHHGKLYQGDCLSIMADMEDETVDVVFADPPFNLNKLYPSGMNDNLSKLEYIKWTEEWLNECIRILKKGGSLFLWNLPKWNTYFAEFLNFRLTFRHWISVDIKYSLPIQSKLYPSHYSLLYYVKGKKANTFHPDRLPMEVCPKCYADLKDYGGYKDKMNPRGINLTDVWYDIPPVRHSKFKGRKNANELSIKLMDRIIEMSSNPGDLIFDPFGGAGTSYIISEIKERNWVGAEIGPVDDIIQRFNNIDREKQNLAKYRKKYNNLFLDEVAKKRILKGLWTDKTVKNKIFNTK